MSYPYYVRQHYTSTLCSGLPYLVVAEHPTTCKAPTGGVCNIVVADSINIGYLDSCAKDDLTAIKAAFGTNSFAGFVQYSDSSCDSGYVRAYAYEASGDCLVTRNGYRNTAVIEDDGGVTINLYANTSNCVLNPTTKAGSAKQVADSTCVTLSDGYGYVFFSSDSIGSSSSVSASATTSTDSSTSTTSADSSTSSTATTSGDSSTSSTDTTSSDSSTPSTDSTSGSAASSSSSTATTSSDSSTSSTDSTSGSTASSSSSTESTSTSGSSAMSSSATTDTSSNTESSSNATANNIASSSNSATNNIASSNSGSASATGSPDSSNMSSGSDSLVATTKTQGSGLSSGALIGIIVGSIAAVFLVAAVVFWYRRRKRSYREESDGEPFILGGTPKSKQQPSLQPATESTFSTKSSSQFLQRGTEDVSVLWEDEVIVGSRVDRQKIIIDSLISKGGYGEVYKGTFNRSDVAIKTLLPETRRNLVQVNAFLAEAKLMASLDHPSIVRYVGVAWESLNDLCVLSELMDGGDLRGLLVEYESTNHPTGFDYNKAKIAHQIAHALTYLHSLLPLVIHRDLKSNNVLLDRDLNAKLTDFGVSREYVDRTMTVGVGSSFWMAPEVMMGEKYDEKADMFSFGVMLSELDVHKLPYSHARVDTDGRRQPDAAILQKVAMGSLHVEFSEGANPELIELGLACVAIDPKDRPAAPVAMYKLLKVLRQLSDA